MRNLKDILKQLTEDNGEHKQYVLDDAAYLNGTSKYNVFYISLLQLENMFGEPNIATSDGIEYGFSPKHDPDSDDTGVGVSLFLSGGDKINPSDDEAYQSRFPWSVCAQDWYSAYDFIQWLRTQIK